MMKNLEDLAEWRHTATVLAVDLGKLQDYTAISIINQFDRYAVPNPARAMAVTRLHPRVTGEVRYEVPYLRRLPLGTDYVQQVATVDRLYGELKRRCKPRPTLVIDATGVGQPVADMFRHGGLQPIEIWFSGGNQPTTRPFGWNVPKRDIISALQRTIGRGELKIANQIPEAAVLVNEAVRMQAVQQPSGYVRFEHREGEHDDLLLSLGIGLWYLYQMRKYALRTMPAERLGL